MSLVFFECVEMKDKWRVKSDFIMVIEVQQITQEILGPDFLR